MKQDTSIRDWVAIVTGGGASPSPDTTSTSVGSAISQVLAARGCRIVVVDRDTRAADATANTIVRLGGNALALTADLTRPQDCERVVADTLHATGRLDALINSLGIHMMGGQITSIPLETLDRTMDVNLHAMMLMARFAIPHLSPGSAIVNVASTVATRPNFDDIAYCVSKSAVIGLTVSLAVQHGRSGIRVNCVSPGPIWTPMIERRWAGRPRDEVKAIREERKQAALLGIEGTAWDVAEAVAFLTGPASRWITGQTLTVDGGITLWPYSTHRTR